MSRFTTKLFVVALTAGTLAIAAQANAGCHGGGGGYRGGYRAPHYPTYRAPSYPRQVQTLPAQPQPQPQFQPQPQQQVQTQQPGVTGQQPQAPAQNGLAALGGTQQQQAPAAGNQQTAEMTALQVLAGMGGNQAATQPTQTQPAQTQQPQQTQPQAAPQQAQTPAAQPTNERVGTWVAKVGSEATVRLDLRADGSFTWTATRGGKTSDFQGQYSLQGNTLTLIRADKQSLAGQLSGAGNSFSFKLNGAQDNGLNFARA
jgi:hypothetical protein